MAEVLTDALDRTRRFPIGASITVEQLAGRPYDALAELRRHEPVSWVPARVRSSAPWRRLRRCVRRRSRLLLRWCCSERSRTLTVVETLLQRLPDLAMDLAASTAPTGLIFRKPDRLVATW